MFRSVFAWFAWFAVQKSESASAANGSGRSRPSVFCVPDPQEHVGAADWLEAIEGADVGSVEEIVGIAWDRSPNTFNQI